MVRRMQRISMLYAVARMCKTGAGPLKCLDVWEMLAVLGKSILDFRTRPIRGSASTAVWPEPHWTSSFFHAALLTSIKHSHGGWSFPN